MDGNIDKVREALSLAIIIIEDYKRNTDFLQNAIDVINSIDTEIRSEYERKIAAAMVDVKTISKTEMPSAKDVLARLVADTMQMDRYYKLEAAILGAEPAQDNVVEMQERIRDEDGLELSPATIRKMMAQDDGKPEAFASAIVKELRANWAFDTEDALSVLNGATRRLKEAKEWIGKR